MPTNRETKFPLAKNEMFYYDEQSKSYKPALTQYGSMKVTGVQQRILDAFEFIDTNLWDVKTGQGDIVTTGGNTAGSGYVKISKSLVDEGQETTFTSKFIIKPAFRFALGMSLSQRIPHQRFSLELIGVDEDGNEVATMPVNNPITVSSLSQSTTTLTVNTATPHGLVPADRIVLWGHADSRFNYGESYVATVVSPTQFTVTTTMTGTIPSVTASPAGTSMVSKVEPFQYGDNVLGVVWEGNSATNSKLISRTQKSVLFESPATAMGTNHTNATVANANGFADAFNPAYLYDLRFKTEGLIVRTFPVDSASGYGGQIKRTQVIPDITTGYKIRIRARNNQGMSKPVGKIINAVKAGSTTATITTDVPHGLTVNDQVMIYGNRDQTNFANLTTATNVASIVDSKTFTIAYGASFTGNSRGGTVIKINGSYGITPSPIAVQSMSASGGLLTIVGNTTWSGFSIGETVDLHGLVDASTATQYTQYEGTYQVANISTTSLVLYAPSVADFASINMGGTVIKRTDFRLHLLRVLDYTRQIVEMDGGNGNYADVQEAIPAYVQGTVTASSTTGIVAHDGAVVGNPVRIGSKAITSNTSVNAHADVADMISTLTGAIIQKPFSIPEADWSYAGKITASTADVALKTATASVRNYITAIQFISAGTGAVATEVVIKDGTTIIWRGFAPINVPVNIDFPSPLKSTVNTALNIACLSNTTDLIVSAQGYQAP